MTDYFVSFALSVMKIPITHHFKKKCTDYKKVLERLQHDLNLQLQGDDLKHKNVTVTFVKEI